MSNQKSNNGRRNWNAIMDRLNHLGKLTIKMGSAKSAQVTRVRILDGWDGVDATTRGPNIILSLA